MQPSLAWIRTAASPTTPAPYIADLGEAHMHLAQLPRIALALTGLALSCVLTAAPADAGTSCVPPPVAHRGDSARAPENTMPAFRRALRHGVRRLELDVRFTNGDVPVLMHDPTVDRTTDGSGEVSELSLADIRALDAGSWFSARYRAVRLPTLYEVLARAAKFPWARVQVELKTRPTAEQMKQILDRVRWSRMSRRVVMTSFDEQTVLDVRAAAPELRTAIADRPRYRPPGSVLRYGHTYVVNADSVTRHRASRWRQSGIELRPWTVDTVSGWRRMAYDDAVATITNRPTRYLAWARHRCR